jgi:hypothetical protein
MSQRCPQHDTSTATEPNILQFRGTNVNPDSITLAVRAPLPHQGLQSLPATRCKPTAAHSTCNNTVHNTKPGTATTLHV